MDLLDVNHTEAFFIGDSDADILAGKQGNIYTVGVQWLKNYDTVYFTIEPNVLLKNVSDFITVLKVKNPEYDFLEWIEEGIAR
ncbi:hypothetical protein ACQKII_05415 [Lysinibacillus sp. NPDC048646]|uniref:hypothetical protein n=1 Tax=Lysinibacillus sp. NPDC048646 TaxID=3390574 RepID=UPI003CFC2F2E